MSDPAAPLPANVVSFRKRVPAVPVSGQDRLSDALAALEQALADQRRAVADWRASLAELGQATAGLARGLARYRTQLDMLETRVGRLDGAARKLAAWADDGASRKQG